MIEVFKIDEDEFGINLTKTELFKLVGGKISQEEANRICKFALTANVDDLWRFTI